MVLPQQHATVHQVTVVHFFRISISKHELTSSGGQVPGGVWLDLLPVRVARAREGDPGGHPAPHPAGRGQQVLVC